MNDAGGIPTAKSEKEQKFRATLNALNSLEEAVIRLESITDKLCGSIPQPDTPEKMTEVNSVAGLLSDTPSRINSIESEIDCCTNRLCEELD